MRRELKGEEGFCTRRAIVVTKLFPMRRELKESSAERLIEAKSGSLLFFQVEVDVEDLSLPNQLHPGLRCP